MEHSTKSSKAEKKISTARALRRLIGFQIKLALDALRDVALSPISIVVFLVDAIRRPPLADSWHLRLMRLGRRSDQVINLFEEHAGENVYTVDVTLHQVRDAVRRKRHQE